MMSAKIFHSFLELAEHFGINKRNEAKPKEEQVEKFKKYHLCPACHVPMTYCGGNIMVCQNKSCKGIKHTYTDSETGTEKTWYSVSYQLLDAKGEKIASKLLSDK